MANSIDLIVSKEAQAGLDALYKSLTKTHEEVVAISKLQLSFNGGSSPKSVTELNEKIKENIRLTGELSEAERKLINDTNKLETQKQKIIATQIKENNLKKSNIDLSNKEAKEADRVRIANEKLASAYLQLSKQQAESARKVQDIIARGKLATQTQKEYNRELDKAQIEFAGLNKKVLQADAAVGKFNRNVGNYPAQAISGLTSLMGAFGIAGGLSLFADITKDIYNTTKELQSLDLALKQVVETDSKFAESQAFLSDISEKYGIELKGLTKQFTQFYVSAKDKISGKEIQQIFESVAKSAGFMGLSVDAQNRAFVALNQMMSKGTVSAEELKGQLGEALPGAFGIMAKAMGVTERQLGKMMQDGKVLASEVLPKFAKQLEITYGIENKNRVDSLAASQTRLTNAWTDFIKQLNYGESVISNIGSKVLGKFQKDLSKFTEFLKSDAQKRSEQLVKLKQIGKDDASILLDRYKGTPEQEAKLRDIVLKLETKIQEDRKKFDELNAKNASIQKNAKRSPFGQLMKEDAKAISDNLIKIKELNNSMSSRTGKLEAYKEALKGNIKVQEEDTETKKEKIKVDKIIKKNTEDYFNSEISRLEKLRSSVATTTKEYESYNAQIEFLTASLMYLRNEERMSSAGAVKPKDGGIVTSPLLHEMPKAAEVTKKATEEMTGYLKGFYDQFGSESGMPTLFKALNNEIEGFGDNWKTTAVAMMEIGQELTNTLMKQSESRFNAEYSRLEQQKDIAIAFAGDSTTAKAEIERQYEEKRKAIQRRQAEAEKRQAMFNIVINTAQAVIATLGQAGFAGIPLSLIVGAIGAAQLAMVASQEIPAFAEGGIHEGGKMLINDAKGSKYQETVVTPDGKVMQFKGRNKVVDAPKGTQIFTPDQWSKQINNLLLKNNISPLQTNQTNGINKEDLESVFRKYSGTNEVAIDINENGFKKMINSNGRTREVLNSRLTTKGRIV
jgi:tape measure domain-containing protein